MGPLQLIVTQFGLPGLIGFGLGFWLFGTKVKNDRENILGMEPWHWVAAGVAGSIVSVLVFAVLTGSFAGAAAS